MTIFILTKSAVNFNRTFFYLDYLMFGLSRKFH